MKRFDTFLAREDNRESDVTVRRELPVFVSRWVDHSNKVGFLCQMSDGTYGASFKDGTKLGMSSDGKFVEYEGEFYCGLDNLTCLEPDLRAKYLQLTPLVKFMEKLEDTTLKQILSDQFSLPRIKDWKRNKNTIVMEFKRTIQVNFREEHIKVVIWENEEEEDMMMTVISREGREDRAETISLVSDSRNNVTGPAKCLLSRVQAELRELTVH